MNAPRRSFRLDARAAAALAVLGLVVFLPRLSAFGLWDPYEIRIADTARDLLAHGGSFHAVGQRLGRSPLAVWLIAAGFRTAGVGELGGRLPIALTSLLALLACYYAGRALLKPRAALLGSALLALSPAFLLGARQLTTQAPLVLATALAFGGLLHALGRGHGLSGRALHLALGLGGLCLGYLAAGLLVGMVAPLVAVALALLAVRRRLPAVTLGAIALGLGWAWLHQLARARGYSTPVGGTPHDWVTTVVFTSALKPLGFALFPWIALAPMAVAHALGAGALPDGSDGNGNDDAGAGIGLVAWMGALYLAATAQGAAAQELLVPAAPPILLLVGAYLDDLAGDAAPRPFAACVAAVGAILLGHDLFLGPDAYLGAHMSEPLRWSGTNTALPWVLLVYSLLWAALALVALGWPLSRPTATPDQAAGRRARAIGLPVALSLIMALTTAHWLVPLASRQLSARELYGKARLLDPKAPLGQYRFDASSASYYSGRTPEPLNTLEQLFAFLGRGERVFVLAGADELPAIDQHARQAHGVYYVIDDSNERFTIVSNRLGNGERDLNPLTHAISERAPTPAHSADVNFDNKVQLIGWDLPARLTAGQPFTMRLYYKVLAPVGAGWRVFVHIDGAGSRVHGDHVPLEGRFPTQYWVPGTYITDEHLIKPDRVLEPEPAGVYQIFTGFFLGNDRLKVVSGAQDGEQRARLGTLVIN